MAWRLPAKPRRTAVGLAESEINSRMAHQTYSWWKLAISKGRSRQQQRLWSAAGVSILLVAARRTKAIGSHFTWGKQLLARELSSCWEWLKKAIRFRSFIRFLASMSQRRTDFITWVGFPWE